MSVTQSGRLGRWLAAPLAATGLIVLVACGGSAAGAESATSTSGSTNSTAGGGAAANADMEKFRSCLAENGVTLPEPGADGSTPPSGAPGPDGAKPDGARPEGASPAGGAPGATPPAPQGVDADAWAKATQACADLAPTPPGGGGAPPAGGRPGQPS